MQQYPGSSVVVVEVTPQIAAQVYDDEDGETLFAYLHNIGPECRHGNAVKIVLK
jgi:hypothetical protein